MVPGAPEEGYGRRRLNAGSLFAIDSCRDVEVAGITELQLLSIMLLLSLLLLLSP